MTVQASLWDEPQRDDPPPRRGLRLLHTSDWHLGQTLHNFERTWEHQQFLDWLLATLVDQQVDALLIAGDVFDNANPSAASQRQFYHFLHQARARLPALDMVVIAGNHDSPGRLEAPQPLLDALHIRVVGQTHRDPSGRIDPEPLVQPLRDRQGRVAAWCLAVPFLRPGDVPRLECAGDPYLHGVDALYRQALELALARRQPDQAIVALGHCHMVGGEVSNDSERRILVGGAEALPAGIFDPAIAYGALGHLHLAQAVGGQARLRYSGSPLPLSFAELAYTHQVLLVDLDGAGLGSVTSLAVPRAVQLLRVPAQPEPLEAALAALAALDLPERPEPEQPYLEVRVRLDAPEPGLRSRVEAALAGKPVRLARIETSTARGGEAAAPAVSLDDLQRLQPEAIFKRLYQDRYGSEAPPDQLAALAELLLAPAGGEAP